MDENQNFSIKLPQFQGPFDLLLFFIERDELAIHDIPIARITNEFLEYLHHLNKLNIEFASEFIFVAATLMRIKAKMLLPRPEMNEEGNEIDLHQDLVERLIAYKRFKKIAEAFKLLEEQRALQAKRGNIEFDYEVIGQSAESVNELSTISVYKLSQAYKKVMSKYDDKSIQVNHIVTQYPYTIEKQKIIIADFLAINSKFDFKSLRANSESKVQFVYNFLAILEMLQQQIVQIEIGLGYNNFLIELKQHTND
jgi:segregation and condensation protein A